MKHFFFLFLFVPIALFANKTLQLEIAKTEEFVSDVRMQRADTNGMHVLGFLGDFAFLFCSLLLSNP